MIFASDNWSGASDRVVAALAEAAKHGGPAYGGDRLSEAVEKRFCEIFERDVAVFFVASGTIANALALATYARPGGIVFAHRHAHILLDEAGAIELFSGGNKISGLDAVAGKLAPETLLAGLAKLPDGRVHLGQPVAVSLTQTTEYGAVYGPDEIAALSRAAKTRGLAVHMDGARFAGAVASLGLTPAEITWRAGVDVLSFGGTKNGCFAAEAVVFFNPSDAGDFAFARQRAGQGYSKNWFIAAQLAAYLDDGHWLDLARHANEMGARLARKIETSGSARLALVPDANELFVVLKKSADERLRAAGAEYYNWPSDDLPVSARPGSDETMVRLVTSFQTKQADIDGFADCL